MSDTAIKGYARGNVAIPKYYFKVFLRKKSTGVYDATGFWFENRSYDDTYDGTNAQKNAALKACIKTVDDIEELTGFDFFYNLSTDIQNRVEAEYNPKAWGFSAN